MKTNMSVPPERRFLAVTAAVMLLTAGLAFWYAVPLRSAQSAPASAAESLGEFFRVDLNTATVEELSTLPSVGEQKAKAIVEYRRAHGRFRSVAEAAEVPGITQRMIDEWQGLAYVS